MGMAYVSLGSQVVNFNEFQTALDHSTISYPVLPEYMYTFGTGGVFFIKDWVVALEGDGFFSTTETFGPYQSRLSGGYVTLDTGFLLRRTKTFIVYPLLGIGGASLSYKIFQDPGSLSFAQILDNPQNEVTLNNKSIFFHIAMAAQLHFNFSTGEESGNFFLGIRGGYKTTVKAFDWYIQGTATRLTDSPVIDLDGYYIQLMIGLSGENFLLVD